MYTWPAVNHFLLNMFLYKLDDWDRAYSKLQVLLGDPGVQCLVPTKSRLRKDS